MKKLVKSTILVLLPFLALSLNAQEIEEIKKCSLISDPMKRLACFDDLVKGPSESPEIVVKQEVERVLPAKTEVITEKNQAEVTKA